jgi:hypothetical protein
MIEDVISMVLLEEPRRGFRCTQVDQALAVYGWR